MKTAKIINMVICAIVAMAVILSDALPQNKIVVTVLMFLITLFWASLKPNKQSN